MTKELSVQSWLWPIARLGRSQVRLLPSPSRPGSGFHSRRTAILSVPVLVERRAQGQAESFKVGAGNSNYLRLDVTSPSERLIQIGQLLAAAIAAVGIFQLTLMSLSAQGDRSLAWITLSLGGGLYFLLALVASMQDDTYLLHFPTRQLMYQQRGPFGVRMQPITSFEEIRAVGVDYFHFRKKSGVEHRYCLVLVSQDGSVHRVSDWRCDGYAEASQMARMVGPTGPWPVLDQGEFQAIQVQVAKDGRRWVTQVDQGWLLSAQALVGLVFFVGILIKFLWDIGHNRFH